MDDNGHGTHVAGIIAASGERSGVASDASITAYKVLNRNGAGYESDIIAGVEAAIDPHNPHRADVINMSLSAPGDSSHPLARAAQQAVEAGVVVVASAGNRGPGYETIGSPGAAADVLTVGASLSRSVVPSFTVSAPEEVQLPTTRLSYSADPPESEETLQLVNVGEGKPEDYDDVDVNGSVLLIQSDLPAIDKAVYAEEKGARAVLFYASDDSPRFPAPLEGAVPAQFAAPEQLSDVDAEGHVVCQFSW